MTLIKYSPKNSSKVIIVLVFVCNFSMTSLQRSTNIIDNYLSETIQTTEFTVTNYTDVYIFFTNSESMSQTSIHTSAIGSGAFSWDKVSMQASEYQITYCARLCQGNNLFYLQRIEKCPAIECYPCDCNKPLCKFYGTCCPDYYTSPPVNISAYRNLNQPIQLDYPFCEEDYNTNGTVIYQTTNSSGVKFICDFTGNQNYIVIKSCPADYGIGSVERARCVDNVLISEMDLETFLPVTDNSSGFTYLNRYCAICNGVTNFVNWTIQKKCHTYMKVYQANTPDEFLRLSLAPGSGCTITKEPPTEIKVFVQPCRRSWLGSVVSSCNTTGQWNVYDEDVLRACESISGIANRTRFGNIVYKNIFCAVCNMNESSNIMLDCTDCSYAGGSDSPLPFSFLLNLNSHSSREIDDCPENTVWAGHEKTCLPLQCSRGKILMNGTCTTTNKEITELFYQLHLAYILHDSVMINRTQYSTNVSREYFILFQERIVDIITNLAPFYDITLFMVSPSVENNLNSKRNDLATCSELVPTSGDIKLPWMSLDVVLMGSIMFSRDELEILYVDQLVMTNISLSINEYDSMILKPVLPLNKNYFHSNCYTNSDDKVLCLSYSLTNYPDFLERYSYNELVMIEPQLNCAFISFNGSDYSYRNSSPYDSSITLYLGNVYFTISKIDDLNMVSIAGDGTLNICQELWNGKIKSYLLSNSKDKESLVVMSQYILSWVCLLSSIICLVVTVMTYFLFSVLRSIAGKNNIFLSISLLLAQSFLLSASHVKQTGHLCTFLAISTHFLWLSMFCWCFTTCFHMFQVFSAKTRTTHTSATCELLHIVKNVAGCSVIPALIVIGVIVTNYFTTEGQLIGYGHEKCFLDSTPLVAITLVTPLSFILVCNIFFFSVTIIKIHKVRKLQTYDFKQDDRAKLYIYIKLSSMTGMFWILNIIAEATDNDPLRFIAIFLNGLQGVFIFLSYICNRRVLKLYARALRFEIMVPTTSMSDMSTMAKVLSETGKHL